MHGAKAVVLTLQRWGNSLAVRIPSSIAREAHFRTGTSVEMQLQADGISVRAIDKTHLLSLEERLERFDPSQHGGEVFSSFPIGKEQLE